MKQIKINPSIEKKVEQMFSLAQQVSEIKQQYSGCWGILQREFDLGDYRNRGHQDTVENIKVRLYAEIVRKTNELKSKKEQAITENLTKNIS